MTPMSRFFRRLSLRKSRTPPTVSRTVASPNSCPNLHTTCPDGPKTSLPDAILFKCLDFIDNPFELFRLRRVNRQLRGYVDQRLANLTEMEVRRVPFDRLSISSTSCPSEYSCSTASSSSSLSNTALDSSSIVLNQQTTWYLHPAGYKILMRFVGSTRVELLADDCWTSKEVITLCGIMNSLRLNLKHIECDAPVIELVIASLSLIDLDRWYAFQCYLQAINDFQVHLRFPQSAPSNEKTNSKPSFYWPNAEVLIIRTTKESSIHLARLLDYGVRSQLVMDRCKLSELRVVLTDVTNDVDKTNRSLNRNLYHFKCWIGSAGFDDRFNQQYSVNVV